MVAATICDMDRIRLTIEISDRARRALGIRAARLTKAIGDLVEEFLEAQAPEDLELADRSIEEHPPIKSRRGRKPGRKPKGGEE